MACISMPAAALIGGVVSGAGSAGGAAIQANAADAAAKQQMAMYQQTRSDLAPFMQGGQGILGQLNGMFPNMAQQYGAGTNQLAALLGLGPGGMASSMSALENTPGYQFQKQQGQLAVDRSDAAKGLLLSGGQLKDTMGFNQGLASNAYQGAVSNLAGFNKDLMNPLYNFAAMGQNAAAGVGSAGLQATTNANDASMAGAQGIAQGIGGVGNAINSSLSNYMMAQPYVPNSVYVTPSQF